MTTEKLIPYLEKKLEEVGFTPEEDKEMFKSFSKYATYHNGGVYMWKGYTSTDTRELYLMGVALTKGIKFKQD